MASAADVTELLTFSLNFRESKVAEEKLRACESTEQFPLILLQVVGNASIPADVRLAGALFFKNLVKSRWNDADGNYLLASSDVQAIKSGIIDLMCTVPVQPRKQLAESISVIASSDFPDRWPDLVPTLVAKLDVNEPTVNNAVLSVAHSIFERWRALTRSDPLFLEIKMVLDQFCDPYLSFIKEANRKIKETRSTDWLESMDLLFKLFYDLNCQDLPIFFEDNISEFMQYLLEYLNFNLDESGNNNNNDDETSTVQEHVKSSVCEALTLYTERYEEEFAPYMPRFVEAGWSLLSTIGSAPRFDLLVSRCLTFLTSVAKFERNIHMFSNEDVLLQIVEQIIIPNVRMRESDLETFEDEPLDFVRQDLEGNDNYTRKQAAIVFLRELAGKIEGDVTKIVMRYVDQFLQLYSSNPSGNWLDKSTAVALFSAIAAKGQITSAGVSTTNLLVDVVQFFNTNMAPELMSGTQQPVLKVDAIRFIQSFRNQLTKEQLNQAMALLTGLLNKEQQTAVYTYAAITLERVLAIRDPVSKKPMFGENDIRNHVRAMSTHTLKIVASGSSKPEELAANEFLMKLLFRILIVSGSEVQQVAALLVPQLVQIIQVLSSNPSNPKFNHYCFESLGACLKYYRDINEVEKVVIQPLFGILGSDVTEFIPYVLQILTEILNQHPADQPTPASYQQLLMPLLTPQLWEARGNVPAIVGLLKSIVSRSPSLIIDQGLLVPLLGVFQQLISSPARDQFAFDILECIILYIPTVNLAPYLTEIAKLLMMRLEKRAHARFELQLTRFIYTVSVSAEPLGPRFIVEMFDSTKPNVSVFAELFKSYILPLTLAIHGTTQRKIAAVGLTKLLFSDEQYFASQDTSLWTNGITTLVKLLTVEIAERNVDEIDIDVNEMTFGSSFSPLVTCRVSPINPIAHLGQTPQQIFAQHLKQAVNQPQVANLLNQITDQDVKAYLVNAAQ